MIIQVQNASRNLLETILGKSVEQSIPLLNVVRDAVLSHEQQLALLGDSRILDIQERLWYVFNSIECANELKEADNLF